MHIGRKTIWRMRKKLTISVFCTAILLVCTAFARADAGGVEKADPAGYLDRVEKQASFANTQENLLPQTIVYQTVEDFFNEPLPEGKTKKKALVIGYDGYRADGLQTILGTGGAVEQTSQAGGLYLTYAGGIRGADEQRTETAPGWTSILTGKWQDETGVSDNGQVKNTEAKTFLTDLAQKGHEVSFIFSWQGHQGTYGGDIAQAQREELPVRYLFTQDDAQSQAAALRSVSKDAGEGQMEPQDADLTFLIYEHTDHAGHSTGYGNQNPAYVQACREVDTWAAGLLEAIAQRDSYDEEDWLILITTDHGGVDSGHGGQSDEERITWLASNRPLAIVEPTMACCR